MEVESPAINALLLKQKAPQLLQVACSTSKGLFYGEANGPFQPLPPGLNEQGLGDGPSCQCYVTHLACTNFVTAPGPAAVELPRPCHRPPRNSWPFHWWAVTTFIPFHPQNDTPTTPLKKRKALEPSMATATASVRIACQNFGH